MDFPTYDDTGLPQDLTQPPRFEGLPDLSRSPVFPSYDDVPSAPPKTPLLGATPAPVQAPILEQKEPFKQDKSLLGFGENFVKDASDTLKGIGQFIFVDIPKGLYAPVRSTYDQPYRQELFKKIQKFSEDPVGKSLAGGSALLKAIADPYMTKDGKFNYDFWYERPFNVLADTATILTLGSGAAAKAANVAGRTTSVGSKMVTFEKALNTAGKTIDPFTWIQSAIKSPASGIAAHFGIGPKSGDLSRIVSATRAEALADRKLATEMLDQYREIAPKVDGVKTPDYYEVENVPFIPGVKTPEEAANLLARAVDDVSLRMNLKHNTENLMAGKLPTDDIILKRVVDEAVNIKWKRETLNRINNYLNENKLISSNPAADWVPTDIKGFRNFLEIEGEALKVYRESFTKFRDQSKAIQDVKNHIAKFEDLERTAPLYVPKYIGNYLNLEFAPKARGFMDSMMKYWSPAVTVLRFPMYQASVLAGNRIMSILAGGEWSKAAQLVEGGVKFPSELTALQHMDEWSRGEQAFGPLRQAYLDLTQKVGKLTANSDVKLRQSIATGFISRELEKTLNQSLKTEKALAAAIQPILSSKADFYRLAPQLTNIEKNILAKETVLETLLGSGKPIDVNHVKRLEHELQALHISKKQISSKLEKVKGSMDLLDRAIEEGNRWAGSSLHLHPIERNKLSRIIPFYAYTKAMTALAFRAPFLYPKRYFALNRLAELTNDMMQSEDAPEWVKNYIPFGFDKDGNIIAVNFGGLNPFQGVRGEELGELPIPGLINPTRNPMFKLVYDLVGGVPTWQKKPITPGENAVRYGDGSVYEYQGDGSWKKIIAQPNIIRSITNMIPLFQAVRELSEPYVVDDRGKPILGPDGKPRFPKDLWTRLLGLGGIRATEYKPDEIKRQMELKATRVIKQLKNKISKEKDPELREHALEILRDAVSAPNRRAE